MATKGTRTCLFFKFKCLTMKLEAMPASDMLSWSRPRVTLVRADCCQGEAVGPAPTALLF